ncbi:hypothetical protein UlMin_004667 [Ulmus minor]
MCPKGNDKLRGHCRKNELISEDGKNSYNSCSLDSPSISQPPTVSTMHERFPPNLVYKRKKCCGKFSMESSAEKAVINSCGECLSITSSDDSLIVGEEQNVASRVEHDIKKAQAPTMLSRLCNREPHGERLVNKAPSSVQKTIERNNVNDSCSSSKSNPKHVLSSMRIEVDETGECSSSSAIVMEEVGEDLSEKGFCISYLRSHGLLRRVSSTRLCDSIEDVGDSNGNICRRLCKICGYLESTSYMLICDNCEEAFHWSCCNPRKEEVPDDEWFCSSCSKKSCKILKARVTRKSANSGGKGKPSRGESNPITLMLRDTKPYTTGVRIGKAFQANIPDWLGPIDNNDDVSIGEPLKIDDLKFRSSHESWPNKNSKFSNWLQCQEIVDSARDGIDGTICGKWRRAPIFEVQTDDWECFCSVLWDPKYADCAVPQELETEKILKQLKYVKKLRAPLLAKQQEANNTKNNAK